MKRIFSIVFSLLVLIEVGLIMITIFVDFDRGTETDEVFFLDQEDLWADTLLMQMNLDEKIGQLFFLELTDAKSDFKEELDSLNQMYSFCGIKFKQTEVLNQLILTNYVQAKSKYPLFIGSEGAIINRRDFNFPIGAIINSVGDSSFADYYLHQFTQVLKLEDVNIEFSNSIDVLDTSNLQRGFSDVESTVIQQATNFRKKLHRQKIISCLNFTDSLFLSTDSAAVDTLCQLKSPYEINKFFAIQVEPEIVKKVANNETPYHIDKFTQENYGFKGLIFSQVLDTFDTNSFKLIFESGTDVFILKNNIKKNISVFKKLVENKLIDEAEVNKRVKRILLAKKWAGIEHQTFKSAEISLSKIMSEQRMLLSWKLYEASFSLLKNKNHAVPFRNLLNDRTHLLVIGKKKLPVLEEYLNYYMDFSSSLYTSGKLNGSLLNYARNVIVAVSDNDSSYFNDSILIKSLEKIEQTKNLIIINYGNPDNIKKLTFADVLIHAYDAHPFSQATTAQSIVGAIQPKGHLVPASMSNGMEKANFRRINRLMYTIPEAAGFDSYKLKNIDSLIDWAIARGAMPGGQVLAAKDGKIFYYKSYGYHTYSKRRRVKNMDIYDLASITKVAGTTLAAMKLYEMDSIRMEDSIKYYLEDTINCTIKNHQLADFFIHKTGMPADMPILQYIAYTDSVTKRYDKYYSEKKDSVHTIKVADNYYLRKDYIDSVVYSLYNLEIDTTKPYLYSDINFNIIYDILLRKIPGSYRKFLYSNFYVPLQLRTMGYMPIERFNKYRVAPTQNDRFWRKQLLRGTPHDESAALYGGVSGNAGLFSNANDLAILFQMLINGGSYGGMKVLENETIEKFISPQKNSRRGFGFNRKGGGLFGHSGFTGCVVWANPENNFVYVFLSNSIHPKATNKRLKRMKIRSKVYDLIWAAYQPNSAKLDLTSRN